MTMTFKCTCRIEQLEAVGCDCDASRVVSQSIERQICERLVADLLAGGFTVSVDDGEEITLRNSTDAAAILGAMFTTDQDMLVIRHPDRKKSWVVLIHGNDRDIISDYGVSIEDVIAPIYKWIDEVLP
jgi:hypothetical protein